jgi:exosortase
VLSALSDSLRDPRRSAPLIIGGLAFGLLFWAPITTLVRDWLHDPEASHGLLLAPVAVWLMWKRGLDPRARPWPFVGLALLALAVLLRYASGLAAELFTMRMSLLGALFALVVFTWGFRQLARWWLPAALLMLSVPVPDVLLSSAALPLQLQASQMGAALLEWRGVPVMLQGNVLHLPGQSLFVTEACSGLRSLTALLALGLLMGGLWLRHPASRALLVFAAIPVAMFLNGIRIFLTGFLVYFVDPSLGEGVMHVTEGWVLFVVAFLALGALTAAVAALEKVLRRRGRGDDDDATVETVEAGEALMPAMAGSTA